MKKRSLFRKNEAGRTAGLLRRLAAAAAILVLVMGLCAFDGMGQKVYDQAGLLTSSEQEQLQQAAVSAAYETSLDLIFVTTADAGGKSAMDYADDFYDDGDFGFEGDNGSGVLFLIDMDNREIYLSTAGNAIVEIDDDEVNAILDAAYDRIIEGDYYGTFTAALDGIRYYSTNAEHGENVTGEYDPEAEDYTIIDIEPEPAREPSFWEKIINPVGAGIRAIGAAIASFFATTIMKRRAKTRSTINYKTYQHGSVHMRVQQDILTHTTQVTRHIQRASSSGGGGGGHVSSHHMSSGGHSHGGGGRHF